MLRLLTITHGGRGLTSRSPLKQCASACCSTVRWLLHPMSDACLARVFTICDRWIPRGSHSPKMLPQPYGTRVRYKSGRLLSSTVWARPMSSLYRCSTLQFESYCVSESSTTSPLTFEIDYIGCPFSRELNTKCVYWCTSVCIKPHQHTSLNCGHWCLNQPIVVTSVPLCMVTL